MNTHSGTAFSLSVDFCDVVFLLLLLKICTYPQNELRKLMSTGMLYVKLPPFDMLSGLFAGNHNYELRDLPAKHPLVEL